ncbi:hypothetical protein CEXT_424421 [Caerostris extrusa]|uniref:Uncharacterized protein n=1 Tax=Caerostris extrusa TaxID=172846 RepID=A0AAV4SGN5_CAEEX|nr:hypothetical protein CEXT_424421 [Caerostris extrusa]
MVEIKRGSQRFNNKFLIPLFKTKLRFCLSTNKDYVSQPPTIVQFPHRNTCRVKNTHSNRFSGCGSDGQTVSETLHRKEWEPTARKKTSYYP